MNEVRLEEFTQIIHKVNKFLTDVPRRMEQLRMTLKHHQDEIMDLEHYLEFNNISASTGYKIAKEIKDVRLKRREIKDELKYLEALEKRMKNVFKHNDGVNQLVEAIKSVDELHEDRYYVPRVRKDLFEEVK